MSTKPTEPRRVDVEFQCSECGCTDIIDLYKDCYKSVAIWKPRLTFFDDKPPVFCFQLNGIDTDDGTHLGYRCAECDRLVAKDDTEMEQLLAESLAKGEEVYVY